MNLKKSLGSGKAIKVARSHDVRDPGECPWAPNPQNEHSFFFSFFFYHFFPIQLTILTIQSYTLASSSPLYFPATILVHFLPSRNLFLFSVPIPPHCLHNLLNLTLFQSFHIPIAPREGSWLQSVAHQASRSGFPGYTQASSPLRHSLPWPVPIPYLALA